MSRQITLRVVKSVEVLMADALEALEANEVLAPEDRVEPVTSGILKAFDDQNNLVLMLNERVPEKYQKAWLSQPVTRAHRRRMQKALVKTYGDQFTC